MKGKFFLTCWFLLFTTSLFSQKLALVREKNSKKFGYINSLGEMVIQAKFKNARSFSDGLAAAEKDNKWGFIDSSGHWAIEPNYDKVKYFDSGIALVQKDNQWAYITKDGKTVDTPKTDKYYTFNQGVAIFKTNDKVGLIGTDGKIILEPKFERIQKFRNGHASIKNGEFWGMINTKGEMVIPIQFEEIGNSYSPHGVFVRKGEVFGIYSKGKINPVEGTDKIWDFFKDSDLTYARRKGNIGFVNGKGKWVIDSKFDKGKAFSNGLAPVYNGKKWGYVDKNGEVIIDYQFKDAEIFADNGLAPVLGRKWGFIDTSGKLVIPMNYDIRRMVGFIELSKRGFINGLAKVKSNSGWGFLNRKGELLGDRWYQEVEPFVKL